MQDKEFEEFVERNRAGQADIKRRFLKRAKKFHLGSAGATIEYDNITDRLYVTFGEPRQGMALFASDSTVVIVDPQTLEPLAMEVMRPKSMDHGFWANAARLAEQRGTLYIPADSDLKAAAEQIGREFSAVG